MVAVRELTRAELRLLPYLAFTLMYEWRVAKKVSPMVVDIGNGCSVKIITKNDLPKFWLYEE